MLAFMMSGFLLNFCSRNATVCSVGRWYSQESSPRANMFFARSASFLEISKPASAPTVRDVSLSACTWYASRESSSSGFVS